MAIASTVAHTATHDLIRLVHPKSNPTESSQTKTNWTKPCQVRPNQAYPYPNSRSTHEPRLWCLPAIRCARLPVSIALRILCNRLLITPLLLTLSNACCTMAWSSRTIRSVRPRPSTSRGLIPATLWNALDAYRNGARWSMPWIDIMSGPSSTINRKT